MNILIAEDDNDIRELIKLHLSKEDYTVFLAEDGKKAIDIFDTNDIDLAVLDIMLPFVDGFNILRHIRNTSEIPVIFLTARGNDEDKILGLGLGGDDYMVKPFSPIELTARIQAQLRRYYKYATGKQNDRIVLGYLILDKTSCEVLRNNIPLELNAKEFKILELLIENPGKVYTKKQIYETIWEDTYYGDDNTIMVHISHIRDKIEEDPKKPQYLKTIRGIGYKMEKINNA
ncbi:Transcriptional regulatory protein WalR [compost metagenome]|uniref:Stage 0 sporulation protein A homolog n=1 Tax=Clostridium intestinale DSM 6191 TaxID=1121320 RepID=A0A1M6AP32_9CLOT|nr:MULTISPECIES: response regulator transcription factor [Clostridium]SHI38250.1 DNA-binding response regulator, OmpR family, contains REC and winged-helix (wHTH) domain [Clostridium intestinale DSM 6191]